MPSLSTQHNIIDLIKAMKDGNRSVFFVDFSCAFDRVIREKLYDILTSKRILNFDQINLIRFIHSNRTVQIGAHTTHTYIGVPQGSLLSPMLFNIYVHSLIEQLNSIGISLGYADDLVMATTNDTLLKQGIKVVINWCHDNGMLINKRKSGIFTKSKENHILDIPVHQKYKFLGIDISNDNFLNDHIKIFI